ncbi:MAG TPA: hypothetical protein VIU93_12535 [Gallionellaceae bacterium]
MKTVYRSMLQLAMGACLMWLQIGSPRADELQLMLGAGIFAKDGAEWQINYRQSDSRFQFGYRYVRWKEVTEDPFTGRPIAENPASMTGPLVNYQFTPEDSSTFYVGVELLKWTRTEIALNVVLPPDTESTTDLYFGGGFSGRIGRHFVYNLGLYLSPSAQLNTRLSNGNSTESSGNLDGQVQIGVMF